MKSKNIKLTEAEDKLANLIWREAPMLSPDLVVLASQVLDWKKSTTYTVLKKLCDKGIFRNDNTLISILLTHDDLISQQSRHYVEDTFGGSLPKFITSFFNGKRISPAQAEELRRMIDDYEEDTDHG